MVNSYLRHGPTQAFGLVCSASSNSCYDGKCAYVPALEDILVWDMKKGQMLAMWHEPGHKAEVTCIARSPRKDIFAVGYADGSIRLWNAASGDVENTFNGHKKSVTTLAFDEEGVRLASGSQDTDIILWDIIAEAGLFRLRGHRDQITALQFITSSAASSSTASATGFLFSSSKDTFMKLWDLTTQHCVQTVVAHRSEIWSLAVDTHRGIVFTGSAEGELKLWKMDHNALYQGLRETGTGEVSKIVYPLSSLPLSSRHRVSQVMIHASQPVIAVQSHDRSVELFRIRSQEEMQKKQQRRNKRAKEKNSKNPEVSATREAELNFAGDEVNVDDLFTPFLVVRASGKIRSFDFGSDGSAGSNLQLLVALTCNALEVYNIPRPVKTKEIPEATRLYTVDLPGHRTDVRTLCLSSDDQLLASASSDSLKLWNVRTTACIRTIGCSHAVCSSFLPGDRHIAVGTKDGRILLYDLPSSSLVQTVEAHTSTVWSLHVRPDLKGLVTGGADKDVKFWSFEHRDSSEKSPSGNILTLTHVRTLKMTDEVLAVRYSPNGKWLAVALLDSTVKVFYEDSLKFYLSLYGHKLPVLSMDISDDSKLIVTSSADKNVKIWGLDFGDCHKSIFAHDGSVMQVAFEKKSHYFWTVGKDKTLKYWDGDKFENIQKLDGHHSEVWALAVSREGNFVVTGSHDKSIRIWEKLDEPLFLEEEREKELEDIYESGIADALNRSDAQGISNGSSQQPESTMVTKQTTDTLMAGERIIEALNLADNERAVFQEYEQTRKKLSAKDSLRLQPPPRNPVLAAYDLEPDEYVLRVVEKIQTTYLQDALLVLPFEKVVSLMGYLDVWAKKGCNVQLASRILVFMLKTHHHQIVSNRVMRTTLIPLRQNVRSAVQRQKTILGYNLAALGYLRQRYLSEHTTELPEDETVENSTLSKITENRKRKLVHFKS